MLESISRLPSSELLIRLHALVQRDNQQEAELIAHLGEVDARRLYLEQACSSMFKYCVDVLHFAECVAYKRIAVARAARRHPKLLEAVRGGALHVSGATLLAPELCAENCDELIDAATHRTKAEIKALLADRKPRPDLAARVRRLPAPTAPAVLSGNPHARSGGRPRSGEAAGGRDGSTGPACGSLRLRAPAAQVDRPSGDILSRRPRADGTARRPALWRALHGRCGVPCRARATPRADATPDPGWRHREDPGTRRIRPAAAGAQAEVRRDLCAARRQAVGR